MDIFTLNKYGVCINPKIISFCVGKFSFEFETAYINSRWIVGFRIHADADGFCSPCTANYGRIFDSEKNAIKYAAQKALDFFSDEHYCTGNSKTKVKVPKEIFSKLRNIIKPVPRQLSLFDFNI